MRSPPPFPRPAKEGQDASTTYRRARMGLAGRAVRLVGPGLLDVVGVRSAARAARAGRDRQQAPARAGDGVPRELDAGALGEYVVGSGDGLLAIPVNLESPARVPSDLMVQPDGIIDLGQYGPLRVVGKTVVQIEAEVNALVAAQTPGAGFIDVRLVNRESKKFYVAGEVNAPGSFPFTGEETVLTQRRPRAD